MISKALNAQKKTLNLERSVILSYPCTTDNPRHLYDYCFSGSASSIWLLAQKLNEADKVQLDFISELETKPFKTALETLI